MDGLAETILQLIPEEDPDARSYWIDRLRVEMPLELYVRRRRGGWELESSAPTQRVKSAVLPVFPRVSIVLQASVASPLQLSAEEG
jgi:hypothetical protein